MVLSDWVDRYAFWEGFHPDLQNLAIYGAGIAIYTALVFAFYQAISRRDPIHRSLRGGWWGKVLHGAETALTFPVISFGYFALISLSLFLMSKPEKETSQILLLSMAAVLGVRVTAHVSERMSNDIAKLLPLSLLAVVLVEPGYLGGFSTTFTRIGETFGMVTVLFQYFVLFILVEAASRGIRALVPAISKTARGVKHQHTVSKRAMMRDIEGEHAKHFFGGHAHRAPAHHEHAPRAQNVPQEPRGFIALSDPAPAPTARSQGMVRHEPPSARARAPASKPRAGPGGSG